MARTALAYREEFLLHDTGPYHPECPARLTAILDAFEMLGLDPPRLEVKPAEREDLLRVHTPQHVDTIERTCATNAPYPDPDTAMCEASWDAALLAAGSGIAACKAVLNKQYDNAFCAARPPGHHAEAAWGMGFCLFNNIAIAAQWLRQEAGVKRVAILDWDIHHGNGTQHAFYDDDTVYYASLHQHPHYPGTGFPEERGKNNTNLNIQMPPGCSAQQWITSLDTQVLPELRRFDPEFLLISCGFDAHRLDPLGRQLLEVETFAEMTQRVLSLTGGRIVSFLEGGYHLEALAACSVVHFKMLQEA